MSCLQDIEDLALTPDVTRDPGTTGTVRLRVKTPKRDQEPSPCISNDINPSSVLIYIKTWGCSHNNSDSEYMAGLLHNHGFHVTRTDYTNSTVVILNSCTVKGPSEQHFKNEYEKAVCSKKLTVLAGCVPQSDRSYRASSSVIGVTNIHRIVEVVEETLKGNKLSYMSVKENGRKSPGNDLNLPKIRKNKYIEIIPISTGCLNNCTYCKTKLARGNLASYSIDAIVERMTRVISTEGIREIWLTSEDLGAWGMDLGLTIVDLLTELLKVLETTTVMLRLGMTNPPYILDHIEEISKVLSHKNVYEFLHIPVQSGSDSVLLEMKREYDIKQFSHICDYLLQRHPSMTIATDIICGYPTETESDFSATVSLVKKYKFPVVYINQYYPRPGTPAARLPKINSQVVKSRTKLLNDLFLSYTPNACCNKTQRVLVTDMAHDQHKFVGHNKQYQQVLVTPESCVRDPMGEWVTVTVKQVTKFALIADAHAQNHNRAIFCILALLVLCCWVMIM